MYQTIKTIIEGHKFQNFIMGLIILNGITMGLETSKVFANEYYTFFEWFNFLVISIFVIEIVLRVYIHKKEFFKDAWSLFDFIIVAISLVPASAGFEIFRILRVLRLFRLITVVPQMRKIMAALFSVIPGIASIAALLTLFFYIFAIMATQLFGDKFPEWFGTLGESFYTLFQIMTLESWSMGIVRPIMEVYPLAWMFFVPFIFIATFVIVNLIIAIVVDAMNELHETKDNKILEEIHSVEEISKDEIKELREDIKELKALLTSNSKLIQKD
ncbi:MAG: Voltage-gated sodium channel subunit [uncultured Sulfurovum sp.]|uniref:Voltage-gated sodium channel subunit n=1 Tax=uncultured Sulfurovum sp. TaxID=269237 RepID=A0A6S6SL58_9BACT|nr:MAG: Voltage-gated sodium channel subunit [uncultured Sulfurovum sp.]